MKNIKPNDLNSIVSNDDEFTKFLEEKTKEIEKNIKIDKLNECVEYINGCYICISKYLIPRFDSSSYEYRELKDIISNLNVTASSIQKLIDNENTLNLIVYKEK